jgi:type IV pilus assembly protein PilM
MDFLGKILKGKTKSFLGVDLGAGGIKAIELGLKDKRPKLLTYGYTETYFSAPGGKEAGGDYLDNPRIPEILAEVCKKARVVSREAATSLPLAKVATSIIAVSTTSEAELKSAIEVEAAKLIDYPVSEAVLDFRVLKEEAKEVIKGGRARLTVKKILLTITRRDLIKKYVDIFKKAGLILKTLETESFALSRSLVGKDKSSIGIIDMGAVRTSVVVVDSSVPVLSRSISVGGLNLSNALAETMGLDLKAAEEAKKDMSRSSNFGRGEIPQSVKNLLSPVTSETRYLFDLFTKDESKSIEKIILTGGSSFFPNLCDYFTKELGIKTFIGNPWARIIYHEDLKSVLEEIGPRFAVAIGLAMREIE